MSQISGIVLLLTLLSTFVSSIPFKTIDQPSENVGLHTTYLFPNLTWVENLAVRSNGRILVTHLQEPEVLQIDSQAGPVTAELIYRFPNALGVSGIAEYAPNVFAVNVGNFSLQTLEAETGSYSVWNIDMSDCDYDGEAAHVEKVVNLAEARLLNGKVALPARPSIVLLADSVAGVIWSLNTTTKAYSIAIQNPYLSANQSAPAVFGVNGLRFAPGDNEHLYFTNTFRHPILSRIPIDPLTGHQTGHVEVIVNEPLLDDIAPDDLAIDAEGRYAYVTSTSHQLLRITIPSGKTEIVAGEPETRVLPGPTSAQFGRTKGDVERGRLYISTNGGLAAPPEGGIVGGGVYAIDTIDL